MYNGENGKKQKKENEKGNAGKGAAQRLAVSLGVAVRRAVADHAIRYQNGAGAFAGIDPVAHPFAVAPAVGAEQTYSFAAQLVQTGGEHGLKFAFFKLFRTHGWAAKGQGIIAVDGIGGKFGSREQADLGAGALRAFQYHGSHLLGVSGPAPINYCNLAHISRLPFKITLCISYS